MVITPKPRWNNELVSMPSLLELMTALRAARPPPDCSNGRTPNQTAMLAAPCPAGTGAAARETRVHRLI